ncbi:MAG TPA: hypothetical protein G4O17_03140 [Dehalococcoidia bacterium]|nr:hypothetical protein [Dehalococcoidia bacterium]
MPSKMNKSIVNFSQDNIKGREAYVTYSWYYNTNPSPVPNSFYFVSKPRYEYYAFFRFLPPVRTYYRILGAIEKLKIGSLNIKDMRTMQATGETVFTEENEGFKDIIALLRRNQYIPKGGCVKDIKYWESCFPRNSPPTGQHFKCLNATVNGKDEFLLGPFDALHQLKEIADNYVRGKITACIVILASLISLLSVFLVVFTNLCGVIW